MRVKNPHKIFEDHLADHAGRYTLQKRAIVDEIFKKHRYFEVEEFIDQLRAENNKFSRATVYRTIRQLLDAGLLQKISTRNGKVTYESNISTKPHDHIICNQCGKILEIKGEVIEKYLAEYCEKIGFHPEYRSLHIYGTCKSCSKQK